MSEVIENELVRAAANGDHNAYRELVIKNQQLVFAAVYNIVHNYDTAEDLTQDVFIKAYLALPGFRGDSKLSTWLLRIATNKALDFCKKANRQGHLVSIDDDVGANEYQTRSSAHDVAGHPELAYLSKERSSELEKQLDSMPVIYKKVIYSSAVDEMSCSEIAESEGVPVKTITSRLYRGRKLLHSLREHKTKGGKKK